MIKVNDEVKMESDPENEEKDVRINEPNVIVEPRIYLDPTKKGFNHIAHNIMSEHIAHGSLTTRRKPHQYVTHPSKPLKNFRNRLTLHLDLFSSPLTTPYCSKKPF